MPTWSLTCAPCWHPAFPTSRRPRRRAPPARLPPAWTCPRWARCPASPAHHSTPAPQHTRLAAAARRWLPPRLLRGAPATTDVLAAEVPFNSWPWSAIPVTSHAPVGAGWRGPGRALPRWGRPACAGGCAGGAVRVEYRRQGRVRRGPVATSESGSPGWRPHSPQRFGTTHHAHARGARRGEGENAGGAGPPRRHTDAGHGSGRGTQTCCLL